MVGRSLTYADLSIFQIIAGLRYAFPKTMARSEKKYRGLVALHDRVAAWPRIASYLASVRRIPFNEDGSFAITPSLKLDLSSFRSRQKYLPTRCTSGIASAFS